MTPSIIIPHYHGKELSYVRNIVNAILMEKEKGKICIYKCQIPPHQEELSCRRKRKAHIWQISRFSTLQQIRTLPYFHFDCLIIARFSAYRF